MRVFLTALLLGATLTLPAITDADARPAGVKKLEEKRLDSAGREIIIRRTVDASGNVIRTRYWVKTKSFGYTPGTYNRFHDIVEPRFDAEGGERGS